MFDYGELRLLVLLMISERPRHGYELIKLITEQFNGSYSPSPGVIYPTLQWLEDMGFVTIEADDAGRKSSRITSEGEAFLAANKAAAQDLLTRKPPLGRGDAPVEIVAAMDRLKEALRLRLHAPGAAPETAAILAGEIDGLAERLAAGAQPAEATPTEEPVILRHKFDIRRRSLTVQQVDRLTPHMVRIVLHSEDLADFTSLGADDHIKLFFDGEGDKPEMRDYTPRRYDNAACTLTLDFALHEAGPATDWALKAQVGDSLNIGGPRGSAVIAPVFDWYLLIGDETALPAIGRKAEELGAGVQVITLAAVPEAADEQVFETAADLRQHWVHRPVEAATDPETLLAAARDIALPEGRGFVWIAAEAQVARALRDAFLERGHPKSWLKAAGYWVKGTAATSDKALS
ncbi:SIP domain-containing protein [Pseudooceanicola nanhaiensis]|uniref:SIP domain-containing protein n=1 Tax=Pseudooceanicola nanhaiensis TaxID=375761 RepID=UPI001CD22ADE|nr:SIP domain-containing protein [Pseudooceanicola nanhaiensis]MCA0918769.1 SIP domain-containing protein [Pseudooceanicola nanhaiensis]